MSISGVSPTKATPLAPPHIPILAGTDCSACHGAAYQAGGFGPATAMSAAKHAFVSQHLRHLPRHGQELLRRQRHAAAAAARRSRQQRRPAHGHQRLLSVPRDHGLGEQGHAGGHMPNPGNLSCVQCHASAPSDYTPATLGGELRAAHGHHGQLRAVPRQQRHGAHLVQQLHAQGCAADAPRMFPISRAPIAAPAIPRPPMRPAASVP
jgi:hypothetical protein